ncbi:MAG: thiamine phosphate synthase [Candidatus Omnitrophota bacterium]
MLYCILDQDTLKGRAPYSVGEKIICSGADLIQIRNKCGLPKDILKLAGRLKSLCRHKGVKLIINDRLDLALIADVDGLHIGQEDIPLKAARKLLGKNKIIGVSCHSLSQALKAQGEGADYVSSGPVFATPTKPQYHPVGLGLVALAKKKLKIPFFAIGDINLGNLKQVLAAGAENICVCREVCLSRHPARMVKKLKSILLAIQ